MIGRPFHTKKHLYCSSKIAFLKNLFANKLVGMFNMTCLNPGPGNIRGTYYEPAFYPILLPFEYFISILTFTGYTCTASLLYDDCIVSHTGYFACFSVQVPIGLAKPVLHIPYKTYMGMFPCISFGTSEVSRTVVCWFSLLLFLERFYF